MKSTLRVLMVWGSETNNTQGFVSNIEKEWRQKHSKEMKVLDVYQGDDLAGDQEKWDTVNKDNYDFLLVVTSSYGEGEPPSGFGQFLYRLQEAAKTESGQPLKGMQHAVLGTGSTCYETFQNCPRHVDKYLGEAGSRRIKERYEWDEMENVDSDVLEWGDDIMKVMMDAAKDLNASSSKPDVCTWETPKSELLPKLVGADGYEIGEGPGANGFTTQQMLVLGVGAIAAVAGYWYKQTQQLQDTA